MRFMKIGLIGLLLAVTTVANSQNHTKNHVYVDRLSDQGIGISLLHRQSDDRWAAFDISLKLLPEQSGLKSGFSQGAGRQSGFSQSGKVAVEHKESLTWRYGISGRYRMSDNGFVECIWQHMSNAGRYKFKPVNNRYKLSFGLSF